MVTIKVIFLLIICFKVCYSIHFTQTPSEIFENGPFVLNCSLQNSTGLTIYFNHRSRRREVIRRSENGSIQYRINSANSNQHDGEYECVASRQGVANDETKELYSTKIVVRVWKRDTVRSSTKIVPVIKGGNWIMEHPFEYLGDPNSRVGWQKNDEIIEYPSNSPTKPITILPDELPSLQLLKAYKITTKTQKIPLKEEIIFQPLLGPKPTLSTFAIYLDSLDKIYLSCDIIVKNLTSIHIFDASHEIANTIHDHMDLHSEFIPYTKEHHIFKLFFTKEQFQRYAEPFFCKIESFFGNETMAINVDEIRQKTSSGQKFSYATGTTSFMASDMPYQQEIKILEGNSLNLSCLEGREDKQHVFNWLKDNRPLSHFTNKFSLPTTTKKDQGLYICSINDQEIARYNILIHQQCSPWTSFSPCSVSCGTGFRSRTRKCLTMPGLNCNETNFEVEICRNDQKCTPIAPVPLRTAPSELIEWHGNGFQPYKDTEYDKDGINCMKGFTLDVFKKRCVDINECKRKNSCPKGLKCVNTSGGYNCITCPKGFMGINGRCLDINECSVKTHNCAQNCVNTHGSYRCDCKIGFNLLADGINCEYQDFD